MMAVWEAVETPCGASREPVGSGGLDCRPFYDRLLLDNVLPFIAIDLPPMLRYTLRIVATYCVGRCGMNDAKVYVGVYSTFDPEGRMFPRKIVWEDGTEYEIDRILDIRQAAALKAGSGGDRYTVMINGKQTYLFYERCAELFSDEGYAGDASGVIGRWFVERR